MKSLNEYILYNENSINEANDWKASEFFDNKLINDFVKTLKQIYSDGEDSDTNTAVFTLLNEIIENNSELKNGIIGACEDIIQNYK